jgi:asparagine synthase (glutamine-hydrolysing)
MCGILGAIPQENIILFQKALDQMMHRGPDGEGIWHHEKISLGHRRLSIIDLSAAAKQPMSFGNGRYTITYNGEIYNYLELKKELIYLGHAFKTESDTEVLLAAFVEWGPSCLLKFNGMWSFAIWDNVDEILFMSRDRFGKKPLFYHQNTTHFYFSSEMKGLYPFLKKIKPSEDFHWMSQNLMNYESTEKCLIEGIKRFPAGHFGYYKNGKLELTRYWNTLDHLVNPAKKYEDQVEEFREIFTDACKIRMRSDVPLGTALSGGLDSSATLAVVKNLIDSNSSSNKIQAFIASFPGSKLDETHYAQTVTTHLKLKANIIEIDPLKKWDQLLEYIYKVEDLYLTSPLPMIMTYEAVKKAGVSVTLDGHGADELFSGYGHLNYAIRDNLFNNKRINEILKIIDESGGNNSSHAKKILGAAKWLIKDEARNILGRNYLSKDRNHPNFKEMDRFTQQLYILFHETILPTLLRNYDRYSMSNGVEIRMPFMDHRLVSYTFSLPTTSKFNQGYTKKIIRDAVAPFLPKEIVHRKTKIGFNSPTVEWMQGPLKDYFTDLAHSESFLNCDLISNPIKMSHDIIKICNRKAVDYELAERTWQGLYPYLWIKSLSLFSS